MSVVAFKQPSNTSSQSSAKGNGMGFVKLHRQIKNNESLRGDPIAKLIWLEILTAASPFESQIKWSDGKTYPIQPGQLVRSSEGLGDDAGIGILLREFGSKKSTKDVTRNKLKKLATLGMINTRSIGAGRQKATIITVANWAKFQSKSLPINHPQATHKEPVTMRPSEEGLPTSHPEVTPYKEVKEKDLNTNGASSGEEVTQQQPQKSKSIRMDYQTILNSYHTKLPGMKKVQVFTDARKTKVRNFWTKFGFTAEKWDAYLDYIAKNCKWMAEDRPNSNGGFWKAKNLDYLVTERCYVSVKEGRSDDK